MIVARTLEILPLLLASIAPISPALARSVAADPAVTYANTHRRGAIGYTEGYFGKGDTRLHFVEAGQGPLILFYHGFPSFWFSWFDQMERLKERYHVVAVDGLGAGLSGKPLASDAYRVPLLTRQIDDLARHLAGEERFTLIGHDWGAALAFAFAQAHPDRLDAVVGMSAPPFSLFLDLVRSDPEQQKRSHYMQVFRGLTLEAIRDGQVPEHIWEQSYSGLINKGQLSAEEGELFHNALSDPYAINGGMNWYRANVPEFSMIGSGDYWPIDNPRITVPALLIWGDEDQTFVDSFVDRFTANADHPQVVRLPGINHWTSMEAPELANAAIEKFLRRRVRPTRLRVGKC